MSGERIYSFKLPKLPTLTVIFTKNPLYILVSGLIGVGSLHLKLPTLSTKLPTLSIKLPTLNIKLPTLSIKLPTFVWAIVDIF